MAILINRQLLEELGLGGLRSDVADVALRTFRALLEVRVGTEVSERMSASDVSTFEALFENGDGEMAAAFLAATVLEQDEIVERAFESLSDEVKKSSAEILSDISALFAESEPEEPS